MAVLNDSLRQRSLTAARVLDAMAPVKAVYVFGSQIEGRAHQWSDLDIAVFLEGLEKWDMRRRARAMCQVQQQAGLDIEGHLFPVSCLTDPKPASFASYILTHGIEVPLGDLAA